MKCIFCNAEINDNSTKCEYCGKELKEENNSNNQITMEKKKHIFVFYLLIITIVLSMVACFLPYFEVYEFSQNYVSYDGQAADGVFILIFGAISLLLLIWKKRIPVFILQVLSASVFFYDYYYQQANSVYKYASRYYGLGFKMLFSLLIATVVLSLTRIIWKKKLM